MRAATFFSPEARKICRKPHPLEPLCPKPFAARDGSREIHLRGQGKRRASEEPVGNEHSPPSADSPVNGGNKCRRRSGWFCFACSIVSTAAVVLETYHERDVLREYTSVSLVLYRHPRRRGSENIGAAAGRWCANRQEQHFNSTCGLLPIDGGRMAS